MTVYRHFTGKFNLMIWFLPQKLYSLSQESGRNAAKYFINTYPKYFQKDFAEPHVPVSNLYLTEQLETACNN